MDTTLTLDIDIAVDELITPEDKTLVTSYFLCTGGCTSEGGGSMCSWCC